MNKRLVVERKGEEKLRQEPSQRIHRKALTVWRVISTLKSIANLVILIGIIWAIRFFEWPTWIIYVAIGIFVVSSIISILILPTLRWKRWRYEIHEQEVELQYGIIIKRRTLIPMVRVQHVDTNQGPFLRYYKLATVHISTAAKLHEIPALGEEEADIVRDKISTLARVTDDDV